MLLETGNEQIKFKTKPIEGVIGVDGVKPEKLILDGQQRITALYQAIITNRVVETRNDKGYKIKRWYYIDMQKALDPGSELEEAIFSINENKVITGNIGRDIILDLSTEEKEFQHLMYPVCKVDEYDDWYTKFFEYWDYDKDKIKFWNEFKNKIIDSFKTYQLPIIIMKKENPKEAVCQVFEKVNTGGVSLTVFELLTASYAAETFDLKADWEKIKKEFELHKVLHNTTNTDFIQAITLYSTYQRRYERAVSAKRKDMLELQLSEYQKHRDKIVYGFIKAAKILLENHIYDSRDLPYSTQLIPMAGILAQLGNEIDNLGSKNKLMQWFWCGVFGELYGSANETRYALDIVQVVDWIKNNGDEPKTIYDANFSPSRLYTLRTRLSAAYKGIYALLMGNNIRDWLSGTGIDIINYFSDAIDIHHIFPVVWCEKNKIPKNVYDCIINKTPLSGRTNKIVGGNPPSIYLDRLKKHAGVTDDEFLTILKSHLVEPEYMYNDDFYRFFNDRTEKILQKIETAMGKPIPREPINQIIEEGTFVDEEMSVNGGN
jgi:hypothetical protein